MAELLEVERFLAGETLARVRDEMRAARAQPATVLGSTPEGRTTSIARRAAQVEVSAALAAEVTRLLEALRLRVEAHFGRPLDRCEEPQFLNYGPGDYFVAHQDGNTPLLHDDSRFRKVSAVVFLSEQSDDARPGTFAGGSLVLHRPEPPVELAPAPGTLVAFPSETTHEVTPITRGERLTIVSWYRHEAG